MKKRLLTALALAIALQWALPSYMIYHRYDVLRSGEIFYFSVNPVDPYDAFRGRYVHLYSPQEVSGYGKYGLITVGADGFARVTAITDEKPASGPYVKSDGGSWFSLPINRYYMDEHLATKAEAYVQQSAADRETYVAVRVKNGDLVISGLYVDGVPIEEITAGL